MTRTISEPPTQPSSEHEPTLAGERSRQRWWFLETRQAALLTGRSIALALLAITAAVAPIDHMDARDRIIGVVACAVAAALQLAARWVGERRQKRLRDEVDLALMVEGVLIFVLALVSGRSDSLALWLLPIMALAATVGLSVRSGIKALVLSVIVLGAVQAVEGSDAPSFSEAAGPIYLTILIVIVAGALVSVNERELRRGRDRNRTLHVASDEFVAAVDESGLVEAAEAALRKLLPGWDVGVRLDGMPTERKTFREGGAHHLEIPVATPQHAFGAIIAWRPMSGVRRFIRGDHLDGLDDLARALAVGLSQVELVARLQRLSLADPLTGLGNRRAFDTAMEEEIARARRADGHVGLVMLDVDHFKRFNDRHGHQAGDEALILVARVLRTAARTGDRACRIGGEEFALLLPGADERESAAVAERVRAGIERRGAPAGPVTVSLGVAAASGEHATPEQLVADADARLYAAKDGGRNRVVSATSA
jgi:diguanylate cyclase (GGDEF)-like protein